VEPLGPQCGDFAHSANTLDERDQSLSGRAPLSDGGSLQMRHPGRLRSTEPPRHLDRHRTPAMEHRALGRIAERALCSVPVESLQIEQPGSQPEHPALDGVRGDTSASGSAGHGSALGECFCNSLHDHLDPGDLARQRIAGKHALAMPTASAARERHEQRHERVGGLEPTRDPTTSKLEISSLTASAATTGEQIIAGTVDDCRVAAMLDIEYENHVLMTAPG
jgi:hypothetical protein